MVTFAEPSPSEPQVLAELSPLAREHGGLNAILKIREHMNEQIDELKENLLHQAWVRARKLKQNC